MNTVNNLARILNHGEPGTRWQIEKAKLAVGNMTTEGHLIVNRLHDERLQLAAKLRELEAQHTRRTARKDTGYGFMLYAKPDLFHKYSRTLSRYQELTAQILEEVAVS